MPLELPQLAATALGEGVLPPRHCSGRGNLVATTWRTVLEGVLACRLFGTGLRDAGAAHCEVAVHEPSWRGPARARLLAYRRVSAGVTRSTYRRASSRNVWSHRPGRSR